MKHTVFQNRQLNYGLRVTKIPAMATIPALTILNVQLRYSFGIDGHFAVV